MSTDQDPLFGESRPTLEPSRRAEPSPAPEPPELARHRDPSLVGQSAKKTAAGRPGVAWVRPTELVGLTGGRVAGRGIDFQAELARRARRLPVQMVAVSRRGISRRARQLPPLSAFGARRPSSSGVTRPSVGR